MFIILNTINIINNKRYKINTCSMCMQIGAPKTRVHLTQIVFSISKPEVHINRSIKIQDLTDLFNKIKKPFIFKRYRLISTSYAGFNFILCKNRDRLM